jgi:pimeloyl-ACP methyl ester carboxylesterase
LQNAVVDGLAVMRRRTEHADESTPTVLLVHGAMDRAASFGRSMRRLGDVDVIAYDRRGYAGSIDAGTAPSIEAHAADLLRVLEWSGSTLPVVVGHSLGGTIAASAVLDLGAQLPAMAAFESPFPLLDDSFDDVGGGAVQVGAERGAAAGAEHFYRLMVGEQVWSRLRDRDRQARRAEGPALMAELTDMRDRSRALDPTGLTLPVLVGLGGVSSAHLRRSAELLLQHLPHGRRDQIDLAGHGAHLTHPDEFARYCRDAVALAPAARVGDDATLA